ncbi:membrane protein [Ligilactobacillus pabuli]|uniref:Membrane protein n=1 Tax=Ligilactobacillus pabuli TaxID=2886039 RepID=A0ABQ5JIF0_9LACO|nr:DUF4097 family beta strand repeat-containing protein [Ligilactobacillus pabuli]GKS81673.1 membrane protein [Ligilactobacillus pabuli]
MKKSFKFGWLLLAVSIILLVIGGFAHGAKSVVFNGWRPMVYSNKANFKQQYPTEKFAQIDLTTNNADVTIKRGTSYRVEYHGRQSARPTVKVVNDRLTVRQKGSSQRSNGFIGFRWFDSQQGQNNHITVFVPDNVKLTKIRNLNNYGTTKIQGISTAYLEALGSEGDLQLENMNIDNANIEMRDSNQIHLQNTTLLAGLITSNDSDVVVEDGTLRNVEIQQADGDVTVRNVALAGGKMNVSDGDVHMSESIVTNGYHLYNQDGDNILTNVKAGGFDVATTDGDNHVFGNSNEDGRLHSGKTQNVFVIENTDGDNTVR